MEGRDPVLADLARQVRYRYFDEPVIAARREATYREMADQLAALASAPDAPDRADGSAASSSVPSRWRRCSRASCVRLIHPCAGRLLETMARRYYRLGTLSAFTEASAGGMSFLCADHERDGRARRLATAFVDLEQVGAATRALAELAGRTGESIEFVADFYAAHAGPARSPDELAGEAAAGDCGGRPADPGAERGVRGRPSPAGGRGMSAVDFVNFHRTPGGVLAEDESLRDLHPMMAERLRLWRLAEFDLTRLPSAEDVYLYRRRVEGQPQGRAPVRARRGARLTPVNDETGRVHGLPELERVLVGALEAMRAFQALRAPRRRLLWNRVLLYAWPTIEFAPDDVRRVIERYARATGGLGIEMVELRGTMRERRRRRVRARAALLQPHRTRRGGGGGRSAHPADPAARRGRATGRAGAPARHRPSCRAREAARPARGDRDHGGQPPGAFVEHDFDAGGRLAPVSRGPALNEASVVVGVVSNYTERYPEGMQRVALLSDPTRALGSLAEPECTRIIAALDLAEEPGCPVEWFALSAGAKIAMDSGTENMDWIAAVLRRIIEFTQRGGELNVVVTGINVGAQPYWNAEATMLMHTRGILVMTPDSAMVLTGKQALDYSGGVSAEDNFGIGGYERIMGPNGQAQYWAPDLAAACRVLLSHYEHTYVAPGERFPRRAQTSDPIERDVRGSPHFAPGSDLREVGEIFSDETNPGRKKPFDIRSVMLAAVDQDHPPLERWAGWREAEVAVVWDAHLGGWPISVLGIESRPLSRHGALSGRRPRAVDRGHALPPGVAQDRPCDQCRQRSPPGRGDRKPRRLRRLTRVDEPLAARVRRRDRPGGGEFQRADRVLCRLALSRRRVRGLLAAPERRSRGRGARGLARLGDRRGAGRGGRVRPGGEAAHDAPIPGSSSWMSGSRGPRGSSASGCASSVPPPGPRSTRSSSESWPRSSTRSTPWSERFGWGRSAASSSRATCGRS